MIKISSQLLFLLPLTFAIGIALTIQTAINSQLREYLNSPLQAGLLSFIVGTFVLVLLVMLQSAPKPTVDSLIQLPWYLWLGGCLGVYAISISIYSAPQLGFLTFSGLVIFGQIGMSMLMDHYGWLGVDKNPVNWSRFFGGILIFVGVILTLQR